MSYQSSAWMLIAPQLIYRSTPILRPSMDRLNHLWEQRTNTVIDEILEKVYAGFIIQVQPKLFLQLDNINGIFRTYYVNSHRVLQWYIHTDHKNTYDKAKPKVTFKMPFSGSEAMSGMLEPAIKWNKFKIKLLDLRSILNASQQ